MENIIRHLDIGSIVIFTIGLYQFLKTFSMDPRYENDNTYFNKISRLEKRLSTWFTVVVVVLLTALIAEQFKFQFSVTITTILLFIIIDAL